MRNNRIASKPKTKKQTVNLQRLFNSLTTENYCLVKISKIFPLYNIGSDLDIYCINIKELTNQITQFLNENIIEEKLIIVEKKHNQTYIDLFIDEELNLRFDLYDALPEYRNILLKPCFFSSVIEKSVYLEIEKTSIKVPCKAHDCMIRYLEYHEWFSERPDKIKHIEYILDFLEKDSIKKQNFFELLHYYIEIPKPITMPEKKIIKIKNESVLILNKTINFYKKFGLKMLLKKVNSELFKSNKQ